jgi:hypothetical protein
MRLSASLPALVLLFVAATEKESKNLGARTHTQTNIARCKGGEREANEREGIQGEERLNHSRYFRQHKTIILSLSLSSSVFRFMVRGRRAHLHRQIQVVFFLKICYTVCCMHSGMASAFVVEAERQQQKINTRQDSVKYLIVPTNNILSNRPAVAFMLSLHNIHERERAEDICVCEGLYTNVFRTAMSEQYIGTFAK